MPLSGAAQSVVSNTAPKVNAATGAILDIHDGNTLRIGDTFYWYGASYQECAEPPGNGDRIKAHDFSYLTPIRFAADGGVVPVTAFEDSVTFAY